MQGCAIVTGSKFGRRIQVLRATKNLSLIRISNSLTNGEALEMAFAICKDFEIEKIDDHLFKTRQR